MKIVVLRMSALPVPGHSLRYYVYPFDVVKSGQDQVGDPPSAGGVNLYPRTRHHSPRHQKTDASLTSADGGAMHPEGSCSHMRERLGSRRYQILQRINALHSRRCPGTQKSSSIMY